MPTDILSKMIEYRKNKSEDYTIMPVKRFPLLPELQDITWIGSWTWTQTGAKNRWMQASIISDYGAGFVSPSDIARDYLSMKYPKRNRINKYQYAMVSSDFKSQPIYANPCTIEHGVYLDLKSAYWQIIQAVGWDVDYMPHMFLAVRSDNRDFPTPENKLARNSLVSAGLPSNPRVYFPEQKKFKVLKTGNKYINLVLWNCVQDVLHGFAHDMLLEANAQYINTDGYIIDYDNISKALQVASAWGLTLSVKAEGEAVIRGAGDYDIGQHKSKRPRKIPRAHCYLMPRAKDWLRPRIKKFSTRIVL